MPQPQPQSIFLQPFISAPLRNFSKLNVQTNTSYVNTNVKIRRRTGIVCMGMLEQRKMFRKRKKVEVFKDADDEKDQKNWRALMKEIEETGSAVAVLRNKRDESQILPKDLVLGTLIRFKQLKKWDTVIEILEWLRTQGWWDFEERDFMMLIIAYGKQGEFNKAEKVMRFMNRKGYPPSVISHTALMEAYGKGGRYNNAEAIFRRMRSSGPEPSAITYQIIFKIFSEANKFKEAEEVFEALLDEERSPLKPDQKMFNAMIYMYKKAGRYDEARRVFKVMTDRGVAQTTVTYNSLMSFETDYKEVSNIYSQMQRAGHKPDVVSYSSLISAYGKGRMEGQALAVFEEMLDAGVRPTHQAFNILLDAFAISGMVGLATTVFKSMIRDRYMPDICSYTTMLSAYVNASDMEGAEKFFKRLRQDGMEPNAVTYGTLIKGYATSDNLEKMMEKYEEMRISNIKPNQTIFTMIMDAHGRNTDFGSAVDWFNEMKSCGVLPDEVAKNALLSLAKTTEEREEANRVTDRNSSKEQVNGVKNQVDENEDEDEDDEEDTDCYDKKQDERRLVNGDRQQRKDVQVLNL